MQFNCQQTPRRACENIKMQIPHGGRNLDLTKDMNDQMV